MLFPQLCNCPRVSTAAHHSAEVFEREACVHKQNGLCRASVVGACVLLKCGAAHRPAMALRAVAGYLAAGQQGACT